MTHAAASVPPVFWFAFTGVVLVLLFADLFLFHRETHEPRFRESAIWVGVWVSLAIGFNIGVYFWLGHRKALEFLTGYLIEESLSIDNLFVFMMVFSYFSVSKAHRYRVLFWGVLGAMVMRLVFILVGTALLQAFHWMTYVFGGILLITGVRMLISPLEEMEPGKNAAVRIFRRFVPVTADYHGSRFLIRHDGRIHATPLLLVLVVVEITDVIFAVDSIPAVFAVSNDPFIVYTSNIFAILGLRALFFVIAGALERLEFLKVGLAIVLLFLGLKMVGASFFPIPILSSLLIIALILGATVVASLYATGRKRE